MTSTIKSLAVSGVVLTLLSAACVRPAEAQGWGRSGGIGPHVARTLSSSSTRGPSQFGGSRSQPATRSAQNGLQFGGSSAVSVAVGPGGVGVAVASDDSAVAVAVGGGGVGVGVAKDNGRAVSVGVGGEGVSVAAARGNSPATLQQQSRSGSLQPRPAVSQRPVFTGTGGHWNFGRN